MEKPNLLFIFTDEQRYDTIAAYGNQRIEVPNLNRLASEGVVFERAYVTQPICTPSRASIITGLYPHTVGCVANNIPLPEDVPAFPELADFDEYRVGYIGKWHLGDEVFSQHGFDVWISTEDMYRRYYRPYRDRFRHSSYHEWLLEKGIKPPGKAEDGFEYFPRSFAARLPEELCKPSFEAEMASRFIRENADRPFILFVNFLEPHMPFFGPRDEQYSPDEVTLPENFDLEPTEDQPLKALLAASKLRNPHYKRHMWYNLYERFLGTGSPTEEDWRGLIARYWGLVSQVDAAVGRILDAVRRCGLEKNTIIVFTSDHGDMMGSHRLITKGFQFEEAVRVPLIIKIPGHPKSGSIIREPVSQVDLVPTLLDFMGKPVPNSMDGYSLKPFLEGEGEMPEKNVFIEWFPHNTLYRGRSDEIDHPVITVITPDGWKYNWSSFGQDELYNLEEDPLESMNLARRRSHQPLIKKLKREIKRWMARTQYVIHRHIVHQRLDNRKGIPTADSSCLRRTFDA